MGLFDKKKDDMNVPPSPPTQQVNAMKGQGYTNNQIIQALQKDGFTSSQIFDALSGADAMVHEPIREQAPPPQDYPVQQFPEQSIPEPPAMKQSQDDVEELVEAIIDEKWNELLKDINKIIDWKNKTENRMSQIEQAFQDLKTEFDKVHGAVLGKIGDYDKNILEVGAELKAMEKVFSKVLPAFTTNVNELTRITDTLKKKK